MDTLIEGYRRFRSEVWPAERARYESLARKGQRPETLVIACSDSRVDPQTVFGAVPGELFVVRNVAGLVPPYQPDPGHHGTSAALEYAVRVLKVSRIVVLGHAQCGGVKAMVEGAPEEARDFVAPWMQIAADALKPEAAGAQDRRPARATTRPRWCGSHSRISRAFPGSRKPSPRVDWSSADSASTSTPGCWRSSRAAARPVRRSHVSQSATPSRRSRPGPPPSSASRSKAQ